MSKKKGIDDITKLYNGEYSCWMDDGETDHISILGYIDSMNNQINEIDKMTKEIDIAIRKIEAIDRRSNIILCLFGVLILMLVWLLIIN